MPPETLLGPWVDADWRPQSTIAGWETLLGQARQTRLLARLAYHHRTHQLLAAVPEGPRRHLEGALRLADRQQHEVRWEIDCIRRALDGLDVPVVVLKGAAYLMAELPPAQGRLFADIDLLVPREHIADVEGALFAAGWISDERDEYNQRYYREWMHEIPPLRHVHRDSFIDLHHTITPPTSRFNVDGQQLLRNIRPLDGYPGLFILAPVDMVLHSAVHLFQEGDFGNGLRDLLDMRDLVVHFSSQDRFFWPGLLDRADELGLRLPLFYALFHLHRLLNLSAPVALHARINSMGPIRPVASAMAWMLNLALRPHHPSCESRWSGLARWLLYVRSHAIRMPIHLLVPHLVRKSWMQRFPKKD